MAGVKVTDIFLFCRSLLTGRDIFSAGITATVGSVRSNNWYNPVHLLFFHQRTKVQPDDKDIQGTTTSRDKVRHRCAVSTFS